MSLGHCETGHWTPVPQTLGQVKITHKTNLSHFQIETAHFFKLYLLLHLINFWLQSVFSFYSLAFLNGAPVLHQQCCSVLHILVTHSVFRFVLQINNELGSSSASVPCVILSMELKLSNSNLSIIEYKVYTHRK